MMLSNCSSPSRSLEDDFFAIYFLEKDTMSIEQIFDINIHKLKLKSKPAICEKDIDYYDSTSGCFHLSDKFNIEKYSTNMDYVYTWSGFTPFVIVIENRRYFVGSVVDNHSSLGLMCPIMVDGFNWIGSERTFGIYFFEDDKYLQRNFTFQSMLRYFSK